jgi:DNA polymerase-3 subunit delta
MKLTGRDAARFFQSPQTGFSGLLLHGADAMRVAERRQQVIAAIVGPEGEAEMRLTRIPASELRRDKALLLDAVKAQGFFPGPRIAFVEDAGDGLAPVIEAALKDWNEGDAQIVVTGGALAARSALRKLFEGARTAFSIGIYDDPPSREEIEAMLTAAGLARPDGEAMAALNALARELEPGDFRQTLEKLALYKRGDDAALSPADIDAVAPQTIEAALDDILHAVAEAETERVGPLMQRLAGQGVGAVALCIAAVRQFRALHAAASDPDGPGAGIGRLRPPVYGPRRDRLLRQAQRWDLPRLETALGLLIDTDLQLRSAAQRAPQHALVERTMIRLAMLGGRGAR